MLQPVKQQTIHLVGLNGLRAIAALAVVISHVNMGFSKNFNLAKLPTTNLAGFGVTIFFALSGFLITMLLILEKEKYSRISFLKFIIRRTLRIWPLYFIYISINILIYHIRGTAYQDQIIYYVAFIPNIPYILGTDLPRLGHYWSLGVEEQFYLVWPLIIKWVKSTWLAIVVFIVAFISIKLYATIYYGADSIFFQALHVTRFDCMAIGGLGAYFYIYHKDFLVKAVTRWWIQLFSWLIIMLILFNRFHTFSFIDHEIVSVVTVCLIVGLSEKKALINLDNKIFDFLGKISFGIYVYHPLLIFGASLLLKPLSITPFLKYVLVYSVVFTTTIIVAYISYTYFESYFLKLKHRFSQINSTSHKF